MALMGTPHVHSIICGIVQERKKERNSRDIKIGEMEKTREREREERGKQSKGSEVKKREKTFFIYPAQKLALKYRFGLEYRGADCLIYSISPTPYLSLFLSPHL